MTRINVVNPKHLTDQWLRAEYRELVRIPNKIRSGKTKVNFKKIPKDYLLGTGHETFFRDKLVYLKRRHDAIIAEMKRRGFNMPSGLHVDLTGFDPKLLNDYQPDLNAVIINLERLQERFDLRTEEYKFFSKDIDQKVLDDLFCKMKEDFLNI